MKRTSLLCARVLLACSQVLSQKSVKYAVDAWEILDTAFYTWVMDRTDDIEALVAQGRQEQAKLVFNKLDRALKVWLPLKDEIEKRLTMAARGKAINREDLNVLFQDARNFLASLGIEK